jgi:hypothetical protein
VNKNQKKAKKKFLKKKKRNTVLADGRPLLNISGIYLIPF